MIQSVDIPWTPGMNFGMGVNLLEGGIAGKAVEIGPVSTTTHASGMTVSYQLHKITSLEDLYSSIGISVEASGHYGLFSASGKVKYAKEVKFNSQSTFLLARCFVENAFEQCEDATIRQAAGQLLAQGREKDFQDRFGDGFVRGMQNGGEFHAIIAITSFSRDEQEAVGAALQAKYGTLFTPGGEVDVKLDDQTKQRVEKTDVMISTFQRGGQGDETSFTSDIEQVMARLQAFPRFVQENPVPFGVQVASYRTLDLPDGPSPIDIQNQKDKLTEYARIQLELQSLRNDVEFMQLHPDFYVDPPAPATLNTWQESFGSQLDRLVAQASTCARTPQGGCPSFSLAMPDDFVRPERTPGIAGLWEMSIIGGGESTWTLTPFRGNEFKASENGLGNARGIAVLTGKHVKLDWAASNPGDPTTGRFLWELDDAFSSAAATVEFFTVHTDLGILSGRFTRID
jgi:hypothetical protein